MNAPAREQRHQDCESQTAHAPAYWHTQPGSASAPAATLSRTPREIWRRPDGARPVDLQRSDVIYTFFTINLTGGRGRARIGICRCRDRHKKSMRCPLCRSETRRGRGGAVHVYRARTPGSASSIERPTDLWRGPECGRGSAKTPPGGDGRCCRRNTADPGEIKDSQRCCRHVVLGAPLARGPSRVLSSPQRLAVGRVCPSAARPSPVAP